MIADTLVLHLTLEQIDDVDRALRSALLEPALNLEVRGRLDAVRKYLRDRVTVYARNRAPASYNGHYGNPDPAHLEELNLELELRGRLTRRVAQLAKVLRAERVVLGTRVCDVLDAMIDDLAGEPSVLYNDPPTTRRPAGSAPLHEHADDGRSK